MQIVTMDAAEAKSLKAALDLAENYPFVSDAWPEAEPSGQGRRIWQDHPDDSTVWASLDAQGWHWALSLINLDFDSKLFGRKMAGLKPILHRAAWPEPEVLFQGKRLISQLLDKARQDGFEFIAARAPSRDILTAQALEASGFRLVDVSVEWMLDVTGAERPGRLPQGVKLRTWKPEDTDLLMDMAGACFCELSAYADRFAMDPRLRTQCQEMYRRWAKNSLTGGLADQVLVLEKDRQAKGFITLKLPPGGEGPGFDCGWVVLNVISPELRGQGLYNLLLGRGLKWLAGHGAKRVRVRTKVSQQAVIKGFSRLGAAQVYSDLTFHLWMDQLEGK